MKEDLILIAFLFFSIGLLIGFLVAKVKDIDIELENSKLKKQITELKFQLNLLRGKK